MSLYFSSARRFVGTTFIVTGLTLAASVMNFVAQATLAYRFGAAAAIDAYSYALSVPMFLSGLAASIISYIAVPIMAQTAHDPDRARVIGRALSAWLFVICGLIAIMGVLAIWLQGILVPPAAEILRFPGLGTMIWLAWVAGAVQLLTALAIAQLNADGRPMIAASLGLSVSTGTIAALLLFPVAGITVAMTGLLAGSVLGATVGLFLSRHLLLPPRLSIEVKDEIAKMAQSALWATLALSCFASYFVIDAIWASRLGHGSLAAMGYAHRLTIGIGSLIVAGPSALFIPRLAKLAAARDSAGFRRLLLAAIAFIGSFGLLCSAAMFLFAPAIVSILFERGAFDAANSLLVATALRHMAPGVVAMLISVILLRAIFCLPGMRAISAALGIGFSCSYFFFSWLLLDWGVSGLATSYSISWGAFALCNAGLIWRKSGFESESEARAEPSPNA